MPVWSLLTSQPTPPLGTEQWASLVIDGSASDLAYAFRVTVPESTPQSWNTVGYFGVFGVTAGKGFLLPTRTIVLAGRGSAQVLQLITANDAQFPPTAISQFGVSYFIHKWVDADDAQIWRLTDA